MGWTLPPLTASKCAKVEMRFHPPQQTGASDMKVTTVGIDLAKNLFQLHGVNEYGKVVFKKQLRRDQRAEFFVNLPACLIGMEACGRGVSGFLCVKRIGC